MVTTAILVLLALAFPGVLLRGRRHIVRITGPGFRYTSRELRLLWARLRRCAVVL